jgi:hypothetical protein
MAQGRLARSSQRPWFSLAMSCSRLLAVPACKLSASRFVGRREAAPPEHFRAILASPPFFHPDNDISELSKLKWIIAHNLWSGSLTEMGNSTPCHKNKAAHWEPESGGKSQSTSGRAMQWRLWPSNSENFTLSPCD